MDRGVRNGMYLYLPEHPAPGELSPVSWEIVPDDELPYRCRMRDKHGAATTPAGALMACLSAGQCVPSGCRNADYAAMHIFWQYGPPYPKYWEEIIRVLKTNEVPECKSCS